MTEQSADRNAEANTTTIRKSDFVRRFIANEARETRELIMALAQYPDSLIGKTFISPKQTMLLRLRGKADRSELQMYKTAFDQLLHFVERNADEDDVDQILSDFHDWLING